jgi:transposase
MFIRETPFINKKTGKKYSNYRLVESYRNQSGKVRQSTILTLGADFSVDRSNWRLLANRIEEICSGQGTFFPLSSKLEKEAESIAKLVSNKLAEAKLPIKDANSQITKLTEEKDIEEKDITTSKEEKEEKDFQSIDINSLKHQDIRQVGAEYLGVSAAKQLRLEETLLKAGLNLKQTKTALASIITRLVHPSSELSTHSYLTNNSALDELLDDNFTNLPLKNLYKISDQLLSKKDKIEEALYTREMDLFNLKEVVTLYDITNTYFEGRCLSHNKAKLGRSKEKRSDCPLVSLGIILDSSGFPKSSKIFPGNVSEPQTLQQMLTTLKTKKEATIIMDAGIATEDNITWLRDNGYEYIVVSRKRNNKTQSSIKNDINAISTAVIVKEEPNNKVTAHLIKNEETKELELYCHSEAKEAKSNEMNDKFTKRFEDELQKLANGLTKPGATKKYEKILERIGRLKERYSKVSGSYDIDITVGDNNSSNNSGNNSKKKNNINNNNQIVTNIIWKKKSAEEIKNKNNQNGTYCLRTNRTDLDAKTFWTTYTMLTDLEAAFRHLKSELGLRPVYHQREDRIDGHIFITILAYHLLHTIRYQLKKHNIKKSWKSIRETMQTQSRITSTMELKDGRIVNIRKTSKANADQMEIYNALNINSNPGKTKKFYF